MVSLGLGPNLIDRMLGVPESDRSAQMGDNYYKLYKK